MWKAEHYESDAFGDAEVPLPASTAHGTVKHGHCDCAHQRVSGTIVRGFIPRKLPWNHIKCNIMFDIKNHWQGLWQFGICCSKMEFHTLRLAEGIKTSCGYHNRYFCKLKLKRIFVRIKPHPRYMQQQTIKVLLCRLRAKFISGVAPLLAKILLVSWHNKVQVRRPSPQLGDVILFLEVMLIKSSWLLLECEEIWQTSWVVIRICDEMWMGLWPKCSVYMEWNITQPGKGTEWFMLEHQWIWRHARWSHYAKNT